MFSTLFSVFVPQITSKTKLLPKRKEMNKKMRLFALPQGSRFTNKEMIAFVIPIMFEQMMLGLLGIADTYMVSALGETAVAGVALVNRLDNFAKQFFLALGQGGSVVLAQYIGAEKEKLARSSIKNNIIIVTSIGILLMLAMVLFKNSVLGLFFGGAEPEVLSISSSYFSITALSYPFVALYYVTVAVFRVMGRSRMTFLASVSMMSINLLLKYIFIFVLKIGVSGAALSTFIAMAVVGVALLFELKSKRNPVALTELHKLGFRKKMSWRILKVSVPNGIEQAMFQLGALLLAGLVSSLGTAAVVADQIARNVTPFVHAAASGFTALMMMVVGQCMGAKEIGGAKMYIKHVLKLDYVATIICGIITFIVLKPVLSAFDVSQEARDWAYWIVALYIIGSCLVYPTSFAVPAALRGAGDTKFVMMVSTLSMFLFRIGAAYICVYVFKAGVMSIWIAMVSDWAIRTVVFLLRLKKGKWIEHKVI